MAKEIYDVVVVGAGVFGAWTALHLARRGKRVLLVDAYGPGHSRSSSGDESRIIRMGYGADEIYTRWAQRSLAQWQELFAASHHVHSQKGALFQKTGVLWLAEAGNPQMHATVEVLRRNCVQFQELNREHLLARYPQIDVDGIASGIYEPDSGVLMARRAVAVAVAEAIRHGAEFKLAEIAEPGGTGAIDAIEGRGGERFVANGVRVHSGRVAGETIPGIFTQQNFSDAAGGFLCRNPRRGRTLLRTCVTDMVDQE